MGQQQLLLLMLSIVLVGGAVVAGVHTFEVPSSSNNAGSLIQETLTIVHDIQQWKQTDYFFGGGDIVHGFDRINFEDLGYTHSLLSNRVYKSDVGCYFLRNVGDQKNAELMISAPSCSERDYVARVVISGPGPGDLAWHAE